MIVEEVAPPAVSMAEAQAFVRIETGAEEALLAGLVRTASALCEAFIGQALVARGCREVITASGAWTKLGRTPVRSIDLVEAIAEDGSAAALATGQYAVDIDASGDGWVRVIDGAARSRLRISATVGIGGTSNDVPEAIRHGILRLVAHLFASRDGDGGEPPAAVTALWRPYRRMRLS